MTRFEGPSQFHEKDEAVGIIRRVDEVVHMKLDPNLVTPYGYHTRRPVGSHLGMAGVEPSAPYSTRIDARRPDQSLEYLEEVRESRVRETENFESLLTSRVESYVNLPFSDGESS